MNTYKYPSTPPPVPNLNRKPKKKKKILLGVGGAFILFLIVQSFFVTKVDENARDISRLQKDSVALEGNFIPRGSYTFLSDVWRETEKIRDLGKPLRVGSSKDSIRIYSNKHSAELARHNKDKCDSILKEVLPLWRAASLFALSAELKDKNPNTIVTNNSGKEGYNEVYVYSIRYLSDDAVKDDANKYNSMLRRLGFKKVLYAPTPEAPGWEYQLSD